MTDHYFSDDPAAPATRRRITVPIAGRDADVVTAAGVFSHDGLDLGTRVLLREAPPPPLAGELLDLGCGWGPLALTLARLAPGARVWAVDVNPRAVELTAENAVLLGLGGVCAVAPGEVPDDVRFDVIWSNPPIRVGKQELHALLEQWLPRLDADATAWLVVQKNLGADSLQRWLAEQLGESYEVERASTSKGFRVITVTRGA
jgi:16S rRNA (guanine1207-N2)-methyltransferase